MSVEIAYLDQFGADAFTSASRVLNQGRIWKRVIEQEGADSREAIRQRKALRASLIAFAHLRARAGFTTHTAWESFRSHRPKISQAWEELSRVVDVAQGRLFLRSQTGHDWVEAWLVELERASEALKAAIDAGDDGDGAMSPKRLLVGWKYSPAGPKAIPVDNRTIEMTLSFAAMRLGIKGKDRTMKVRQMIENDELRASVPRRSGHPG
jgi:hypothetical protein